MATRHAVVHRCVVILCIVRVALLVDGCSPELGGALLIALIILVLHNIQVLGSIQWDLILQFDGFSQRPLLLILLARLLMDLTESRVASAAVFRGLAGIVLVFVLL